MAFDVLGQRQIRGQDDALRWVRAKLEAIRRLKVPRGCAPEDVLDDGVQSVIDDIDKALDEGVALFTET